MVVHGIQFDHAQIAEVCRRRGVRRLATFGSLLREDFRPDSDIDVLVEFVEGRGGGAWFEEYIALKDDLEALWGRRVDLVERGNVHPLLKEYIERVAWVQYAA
jgi:predicted nucleotidyltransferase